MNKLTLTRFNLRGLSSGLVLLTLLMFCNPVEAAGGSIGAVTKLTGSAHAQLDDGSKRQLELNSDIFVKDRVITEKNSSIELKFNDATVFELGPEADIVAGRFIYSKNVQDDSVSISILKGAFRFVSGLIAKDRPESMEIRTVVATIGIRGTQVIGEANATSATIILIEPEDKSRKTAIEVFNSFGSVTIDEPGYGTEIPDEFSPPSPPRRMRMQTINNLMRSMQSVQRINLPRPRVP